ncbi:MAG: cytochrome P450 [Thermoleophilaceae bacterium]|nr:cytochrome P450 [Thermoleophilaceae bacterium]
MVHTRTNFWHNLSVHKIDQLPPKVPFAGALITLAYLTGRPDLVSRRNRRFGKAVRAHVPGFGESVGVSDPTLVKQVFTAKPDVLHAGDSSPLKRTLGRNSIFALDEDLHLRERRLILPPFHGERMGTYTRIFEEETLAEMATWPVGEDFPTLEPMMRITLNAILRAVFGAEDDDFDDLRRIIPPLVKLGSMLTAAPFLQKDWGPRSPWMRFMALRDQYNDVIDHVVAKHRADEHLAERSDVLALLLQARYDDGTAMSREQISDELLTILVAGHETTAASLAWAVERLRRHPEVLDRLVEEAEHGGSQLREATIWEIQRTRPVIVATERHVVKDFELGEWTVPAGMHVIVDFLGLHTDAALFPEPDRFHPDRFLDAAPDTYSWVPFGGGVRRCAGAAFAKLEMDVVLRMLLTRCEIVPTSAKDERWRFRGVAFQPRKGGVLRARSIDLTPLDDLASEPQPESALAAT